MADSFARGRNDTPRLSRKYTSFGHVIRPFDVACHAIRPHERVFHTEIHTEILFTAVIIPLCNDITYGERQWHGWLSLRDNDTSFSNIVPEDLKILRDPAALIEFYPFSLIRGRDYYVTEKIGCTLK